MPLPSFSLSAADKCSVVSNSLQPKDCSLPGSSVHGIFPGKNIVVGCHSLLQGIFPTQGSNSCLLHLLRWPMDFYQLVPPGKPLLSLVAPFLIHTISVFSDLLAGLWGWGKTLAMENTRLTSFLALGCVFTLTQIGIYPILENHNTSNKVKLYLEDMSQKELWSYPLS